ncbi:MAG: S-layer homology domain-containing protein [Acidimicrobiia bacterium]|nr:S-layer homology domain-containing protein [Acidimicrobiia bacterium]
MLKPTLTFRPLLLSIALALVASLLALGVTTAGPAHAGVGLSNPDALKVHQGSLTVRTDGAVIENLEIRGTLRIEASNVKVRNVWVYTKNSWTIYVAKGSATFDNIEVGHPSHVGERGIGGSNVTVRNADIHHVEDGIKLGSNAFYDNVRVHDLDSLGKGPHADAVQAEGTAKNSVVQNSYLDSTGPLGLGNASVIIKSDLGSQANITFRNNYMNGGNYTIFVKDGGYGMPKNVKFESNRFGPDRRYGLVAKNGSIGWSNNTWASTGKPASIGGSTPKSTTKTIAGFTDIANSVFKDDIVRLKQLGITKASGKYRPSSNVTRGEAAAFIRRALSLPSTSKDYFRDDESSKFEGDINALAARGIASTSSKSFRPDDKLTRGEMAALIVRAFDLPKGSSTPFKDIGGSVFKNDIAALYKAGITSGTSKSTFSPRDNVTRGQVAAFLVRAIDR